MYMPEHRAQQILLATRNKIAHFIIAIYAAPDCRLCTGGGLVRYLNTI